MPDDTLNTRTDDKKHGNAQDKDAKHVESQDSLKEAQAGAEEE